MSKHEGIQSLVLLQRQPNVLSNVKDIEVGNNNLVRQNMNYFAYLHLN